MRIYATQKIRNIIPEAPASTNCSDAFLRNHDKESGKN